MTETKYTQQDRENYIEMAKHSLFNKVRDLTKTYVMIDDKPVRGDDYFKMTDRTMKMVTPCGDTVEFSNKEICAILEIFEPGIKKIEETKQETKVEYIDKDGPHTHIIKHADV